MMTKRQDTGAAAPSVRADCRDRVAVLISGGESLGVLAAVRALRGAGYEPWVAVHDRGGYAARSRATAGVVEAPDPAKDECGFVSAIAHAAARIPAVVVLPGTEPGLAAMARHAHRFPGGAVLGVCPPSVVSSATDKSALAEMAGRAGLAVPPTLKVSLRDLPARLPIRYPLVVKPVASDLRDPNGTLRHYVPRRVDSARQLRTALKALPDACGLVQPYLDGHLGSLAGVHWGGEIVCAVQSRAYRTWPLDCGSMTYAETVPLDRSLAACVGRLLRTLDWSGLFQVDFIEHQRRSYVIDLNPRVYTSLAIATAAGVNLMATWVDLLRGLPAPVHPPYRAGVAYRHDEDDIRALVAALIRGPRRKALSGLLPRRRTAHTVFSIRDPLPMLTSLLKLGRFARRRSAATVLSLMTEVPC